MVPQNYQRDRFDAIARDKGRVGAHRAENPKARGLAIFLWATLATVVLFAAGVFVTLLAMDKISFGDKPTASSSAPATVAARVDTSFNVLILNATTDPSHTEAVKQALIAQGWAADKISDTTSDQTNFEHTTVYYVLPGDKGPALGLAQIFGHKTVEQSTAYQLGNADESPQLTIVIGADFGSGS